MKPRDQRVSADEFIQEMRRKLEHLPGMQVIFNNPPTIQIGARTSKGLYQFTLQSGDVNELYAGAQKLVAEAGKSKLLQDVTSDLQLGNPQASIVIDRDRAASLGVTAQQIESALYNAYGSRQVSTIYTPNNEYWVEIELLPEYQRDLSALSLLHVRSQQGTMVPLSPITTMSQTAGPVSVNHAGQLPAVTLSFNLPPGVSLGEAVAEVQRIANAELPSTIATSFAGTAQAFQDAQSGLLALLVIAIFVIYVVLGILYESFIHPLTILSGLPFAAFGALLTLIVCRLDLDIYGFVGIIMLIGIVEKNAIMMIDFAIEAQRAGNRTPEAAIVEAASVRFRPIMMTTMAALMGAIPIAVGWGAGASTRRPLGVAVVGGLAFSQLVTLYVTPVFYTYLDELQQKFGRRRARKAVPVAVPEPAPAYSNRIEGSALRPQS
jgi:HAE1 family hydrophobic/amphiphilic exporter-1